MTYLQWNDALVRYFFRPELAGQPVWLFVSEDTIAEVGSAAPCGNLPSFVAAVKQGPPWVTARSLCQRALQTLDRWRDRQLELPPYVAYLCLFVLAAGREGDFAAHAYYPRLRALLGEEGGDVAQGTLPSFDRMLDLWDDLERWSARDRNGEAGLFEARIVGGQIHIGLPISQAILSQEERHTLPRLFAAEGFDPTSPPPDDEIARMLRSQPGTVLRARTRKVLQLRPPSERESYQFLLDTVADELSRWNGTYQDDAAGEEPGERSSGAARLCVSFDRVSGRLSAYLRCRARQDLPASLHLLAPGLPPLMCEESALPGWSSPLTGLETGHRFDAAALDWAAGLSLPAEGLEWRFTLAPKRVRIFVDAAAEALPDLIEVHQVPRAQAVYFMYRGTDWPQLASWAAGSCQDFRSLAVREGAPPGWCLASCSQVLGGPSPTGFPELAISDRLRLTLEGGIRSHPGNNFFQFAPPWLALEGGDGHETVTCDGRTLAATGPGRRYLPPAGLRPEIGITLEARRGGQVVRKTVLYLTGQFEWRQTRPQQAWNRWGRAASPGEPTVAGALVMDLPPPADTFEPAVILPPGLQRHTSRVLFLGRAPGQIYTWPAEAAAADWKPVWAVPMGRDGRAIYCGLDLDAAAPLPHASCSDRQRLQAWKETLWYRRKRITEPQEPVLAALWRSYVEAARRA